MSTSNVDSERIVIFEAVMRTGSFSAAARDLALSQPTVRRAIEALESELSTSLFTRSVNTLIPTAKAQTLWPAAQAVVETSYAFQREASFDEMTVAGTVRLSASRVVSHFVLPNIIADLCSTYPKLQVELVPEDQTSDLLRRDADVAIRHVMPLQKQLIARKMSPIELGLFTRAQSSPKDIATCLRTEPFIWEDRDTMLTDAARDLGLPQPSHVAAATDDQALQVSLIEAGVGMGLLQVGIAEHKGLHRVDPTWSVPLPVWLVAHEDQINSTPIRQTFDLLAKSLPCA